MNKILLVSDDNQTNPGLAKLRQLSDFDIFEARTSRQAVKLLKRHSPDFVICAGKIKLQEDGKYVLDLS